MSASTQRLFRDVRNHTSFTLVDQFVSNCHDVSFVCVIIWQTCIVIWNTNIIIKGVVIIIFSAVVCLRRLYYHKFSSFSWIPG